MSQGVHGSRVAQETDMDGAGLGPHSVPGLQSTQTQLPSHQVHAFEIIIKVVSFFVSVR